MASTEAKANEAKIVNGPNFRDLDLTLTDPYPCGGRRKIIFMLSASPQNDKPGIIEVKANVCGLQRGNCDKKGRANNDFIWMINGFADLYFFDKEEINHISNKSAEFKAEYSPITRKGKFYWFT